MRTVLLCTFLAILCGCQSNGERIDGLAQSFGFSRSIVEGAGHRHVIYMSGLAQPGQPLLVFLEGDGRPWNRRSPARDATARNPLALRLMAQTTLPAVYLARPCYQDLSEPTCATHLWTGGRYSEEVVKSTTAAIETVASQHPTRDIILIGYSGGGALAILSAERLQTVRAVVTVAANLDIGAWTDHHGYLPLDTSLNPALSERTHPWREIHLLGEQDITVPPATTAAYFERYSNATRWSFSDYDHVCCWVDAWPALLERISKELERN